MFRFTIILRNSLAGRALPACCLAAALMALIQSGTVEAAGNRQGLLDTGFHQMYSLDFAAAHKSFEKWQQRHPEDPLGPVSSAAAYLFAELHRLRILEFELFTEGKQLDSRQLNPDAARKAAFEAELADADRTAVKILKGSPEDTNALFAKVLADGLKGDYLALIERRNSDALRYLKSSRSFAEKLIAIDPSYSDAYLAIGLENYLLGMRSAPVRWFLRMSGAKVNKKEGIAQLELTAQNGRYLAPFARILLAIAALRENDKSRARELLAGLAREFPRNRLYQNELARLRG